MLITFPAYSCETGLYCMFGQAIIDQSERLVDSAFNCDWINMGPRFRRSLTIFMLQASQPLNVKVGKRVILSRHTFLRLLNGSYSLFNMLHGVQK
ncbi:odorant receptor 2a-like [Schistocerca cancellata]|nr:odorant receptor 2a-like [Schistocerca cancellata]